MLKAAGRKLSKFLRELWVGPVDALYRVAHREPSNDLDAHEVHEARDRARHHRERWSLTTQWLTLIVVVVYTVTNSGQLNAARETLRESIQSNEVNERAYLEIGTITETKGLWQNFKVPVTNMGHVPSYFDATLTIFVTRLGMAPMGVDRIQKHIGPVLPGATTFAVDVNVGPGRILSQGDEEALDAGLESIEIVGAFLYQTGFGKQDLATFTACLDRKLSPTWTQGCGSVGGMIDLGVDNSP